MLWYVLQTQTGREDNLVKLIQRIVPGYLYGECFVAYHERLWRRQQRNFIHVERAFPGYVFITSDDPEALFLCLKQVPAMSRMMADGDFTFIPVDPKEASFLEQIMDADHVIHLSYVATDGRDHVYQVSGPLEACMSKIERFQFRKRYAVVRLSLLGEEKSILMGILLNEDIREELQFGKVKTPIKMLGWCELTKRDGKVEEDSKTGARRPSRLKGLPEMILSESEGTLKYLPGDAVTVINGPLAGMTGVVWKVEKNTVRIGIHLLGQDVSMELSLEVVRRIVA